MSVAMDVGIPAATVVCEHAALRNFNEVVELVPRDVRLIIAAGAFAQAAVRIQLLAVQPVNNDVRILAGAIEEGSADSARELLRVGVRGGDGIATTRSIGSRRDLGWLEGATVRRRENHRQ